MKHTFILQHPLARSVLLAGILFFATAVVSHAQSDAAGQGGASMPEAHGSKATPPVSGDSSGDQKNKPPTKDGEAPGQGRLDALSNEQCAEQEAASCKQPAPEQESFLRRIIKLFQGRDTPPGPNPDVDTNISAGGAGGG